ncbi:MAG: hypothetical protein RIR73_375 [Chloroflexota bacterium]|jgi:hypothetical protein
MKKPIYLLLSVFVFLSSCNVPTSGEASPDVATAAALTVEAALANNPNSAGQSPLASPTVDTTPGIAIQTDSTSGGNPLASFEDVTNCRTGPGVNYERITQIQPGLAVEIVGFYPPNYWVVSTDAGLCWVAGEFVTPSGDYAAVPTVTAPPTPKGGAPENVSLQKWDVFCNYVTNEAEVSIAWADEDAETGYRVVRNDIVIVELSANAIQFQEVITLLSGQTVGYSIIAFNDAGQTQSKTITLGC